MQWLDDEDLVSLNLKQPRGATASWDKYMLSHMVGSDDKSLSEKMILYATTRCSYAGGELTVDYGRDYSREYVTSMRRVKCQKRKHV